MNKIFKFLALVIITVSFTNCAVDNSEGRFNNDPTSGWVQFDSPTSRTFFNEDLVNNGTTSVEIPIRLTAPINSSDLTVNYTIVDVVGDTDGVVSTSGSSVVPAESNLTSLTVNFNLTALQANIFTDYTFDVVLTSTDRGTVGAGIPGDDSFATAYRIILSAPCEPPTIGGAYSVTTEYGYHDFLPTFATHTMNTTIVDNGDGTYFVQDFSGGLYTVGPYAGAYGTGPTSFDLTFFTICNEITWEGQSDPWGTVIPQEDGVNEVDPDTGVVTASWFCNGYGENGVSVYTPL